MTPVLVAIFARSLSVRLLLRWALCPSPRAPSSWPVRWNGPCRSWQRIAPRLRMARSACWWKRRWCGSSYRWWSYRRNRGVRRCRPGRLRCRDARHFWPSWVASAADEGWAAWTSRQRPWMACRESDACGKNRGQPCCAFSSCAAPVTTRRPGRYPNTRSVPTKGNQGRARDLPQPAGVDQRLRVCHSAQRYAGAPRRPEATVSMRLSRHPPRPGTIPP